MNPIDTSRAAALTIGVFALAACGSGETQGPETGVAREAIAAGKAPAPGDPLAAHTVFLPDLAQSATLLGPSWLLCRTVLDATPPRVTNAAGEVAEGSWRSADHLGMTLVHLTRPLATGWLPIATTNPTVGQGLTTYGYGGRDFGFPGTSGVGELRVGSIRVQQVEGPDNQGLLTHANSTLFTAVAGATGQLNWTGDEGGPVFDPLSGTLVGIHYGTNGETISQGQVVLPRTAFVYKTSAFLSWTHGLLTTPPNDVDRDGQPDILWHNEDTGELKAWLVRSSAIVAQRTVDATFDQNSANVSTPWVPVGSNDFNFDGMTDVLWHNTDTGEVQVWYMSGTSRVQRETIHTSTGAVPRVSTPWTIVGTNDFDLDGSTDILWHNETTLETQIWFLNGTTFRGSRNLTASDGGADRVGLPWHIVGTNRFDGDANVDVLWHNEDTGQTQIWYLNGAFGATIRNRHNVYAANGASADVGPPWRIVGTNDFGLSAKPDILWHNDDTNETLIWYMDDYLRSNQSTLTANGVSFRVGTPWHVVNH